MLYQRVRRRDECRELFKTALGAAAVEASVIAFSSGGGAQTADSDVDILNFAFNFKYIEAQFYTYALTGAGLAPAAATSSPHPRGARQASAFRQVRNSQRVVLECRIRRASDGALRWIHNTVAELPHRTRNLMGVIRSMADKTGRPSALTLIGASGASSCH